MASHINRAIELLQQDQAIYYTGGHSGHVLTYPQGREDAHVWADYINVGMEHGAFDMAGLAEYMRGLVDGGPTRSGHRTPTVIVEAPVNGTDAANVRFNAWQFRQILGRGVHGVLLCQAESAEAVRAFVESCRYPHHSPGVERCDPWPLNPKGELLLGVKLESPEGIANCESILAVPGLGFAELGPGDLGLALGYVTVPRDPYPPEMKEARGRVFAACQKNHVPFLETASPGNIVAKLDEGVRVIAGHREETARIGRAHQRRTMPV
jgi:4-hydroxy-2-oxoheptanedioate aldolase